MNETLTTPALAELLPLLREQNAALRNIATALTHLAIVQDDRCLAEMELDENIDKRRIAQMRKVVEK